MEDIIIETIQKNKSEHVRVMLREYKGAKFLDVRTYYAASDGELKPTAKGVSLRIGLIEDLRVAVAQAEREAKRRGLIEEAKP